MLTHLLSAEAGSTTTTLSDGVATIIVVLAILGAIALFRLSGTERLIAIVIIVGVLFVNIGVIHDAGQDIRGGINSFAADHGAPEVAGDITFTLIMLLLIFLAYRQHQRSRQNNNTWMWVVVILAIILSTASWVAAAIGHISGWAARILEWTQQIHF